MNNHYARQASPSHDHNPGWSTRHAIRVVPVGYQPTSSAFAACLGFFTESGTISVQAMNPDVDAPDTPYPMNGYEAFYGTVSVDQPAGEFVVTVESGAISSGRA